MPLSLESKGYKMSDLYSDYSNHSGKPQLDSDYWQNQKSKSEKSETYNLFDNLIKTNFDLENIKGKSVFDAKK